MALAPIQNSSDSPKVDNKIPQRIDTAAEAEKKAQTKNMLGYNTFLTLLVEQMKHQDPTDPSDPTQQLAQLASFSQVEQTVQLNTKLGSLLSHSYLQSGEGYLEKYVEGAGDGAPKGVVSSVKIYSDGVILTLENGKQVLMGPGVVVRNEAPTVPGKG